jgi:hypothetical protein
MSVTILVVEEEEEEGGGGETLPRPRNDRSLGPAAVVVMVDGVLKGRSQAWIRDQARSLTALWMGIMVGMVLARVVVEVSAVVVVACGEDGVPMPVLVLERADGLCLRIMAVKNCCSDG